MIDMHDPIIRRARNNRRLFLVTVAGILFMVVAVLADIVRQL